jgi:hypothetical protein
MAWVQRYAGKGMPEFFVVRADDSTSRLLLPLYTKAGMKQADSLVGYWRRAVPGLVLLDDNAPDPLPLRRAGAQVWQKWYHVTVPEPGAADQAPGALVERERERESELMVVICTVSVRSDPDRRHQATRTNEQ